MRFIENGPDIPNELLDARDKGGVVFVCGAGVSQQAAGLPDFTGLAESVLQALLVPPCSKGWRMLHTNQPIDALFTWLEREFYKQDIEKAVADALIPPGAINPATYRDLMTLSSSLSGAVRLVTTNFDRLFEKYAKEETPSEEFPSPILLRGEDSWGIVHLHGCLPDSKTTQNNRPAQDLGLVLSRSAFGQAYLTKGWAREFVQHVLDKYITVFIGYSADDPPVSYLLEGRREDAGTKPNIYAFQASVASDQLQQAWEDKGATLIPYQSNNGNHCLLWNTISEWAKRTESPGDWYKTVLKQSRKGPVSLKPYERGIFMHMAMTTAGAKAISEADDPPPAEWLCVLDPSVRYGEVDQPKGEKNGKDPWQLYHIDTDPEPPSKAEGEDVSKDQNTVPGSSSNEKEAKRTIPPHALNALLPNESDYLSKEHEKGGKLIYRESGPEFAPLCPRLSCLANWIGRVAGQPATIWWVAKKDRYLHPAILSIVKAKSLRNNISNEPHVRKAWNYIMAAQALPPPELSDAYELRKLLKNEGITPLNKRHLEHFLTPLKISRPKGRTIPPEKSERTTDIISTDLDYAKNHSWCESISDTDLPEVVYIVRKCLEKAVDFEFDTYEGSWIIHIDHFERDEQDLKGMSPYGIDRLVRLLISMFNNLMESNIEAARTEYRSWRKNDPVFDRFRVWAASKPKIATANKLADEFIALTPEALWDLHSGYDFIRILRDNWTKFSAKKREKLENILITADWGQEERYKENYAHRALNRIWWLHNAGCKFGFNIEEATEKLRKIAINWQPGYEKSTGDPTSTGVVMVGEDTDYSMLEHLPISEIIARARKISGRDDMRAFTRHMPFKGLAIEKPVKALGALRWQARHGDFPVNEWQEFLEYDEARKKDKARLIVLIAGRLLQLNNEQLNLICCSATRWFSQQHTKLRKVHPEILESLWNKFISVLTEFPDKKLHIYTNNNQTNWGDNAINASAGHLSNLLEEDPAIKDLKKNAGLPENWKQKAGELISLPARSNCYAHYILCRNLAWFHYMDTYWAEARLFPAFCVNRNDNIAVASWEGWLRNLREFSPKALIERLKPSLLWKAQQDGWNIKFDQHDTLPLRLLLLWYWQDDGKRWFSNEELHSVLLHCTKEFRAGFLSKVHWLAVYGKTDFGVDDIICLFEEAWPKQRRYNDEIDTNIMIKLCVFAKERFPDFFSIICHRLSFQQKYAWRLPHEFEEFAEKHPEHALELLHFCLVEKKAPLPYLARSSIEKIRQADKKLQQDPRMSQLEYLLRSR